MSVVSAVSIVFVVSAVCIVLVLSAVSFIAKEPANADSNTNR